MSPKISNPKNLSITLSIRKLLRIRFESSREIIIWSDLKPYPDDTRVLAVTTRDLNYRTSHWATKIAPAGWIQNEWNAYQSCISKKIRRGITEIIGKPAFLLDERIGILVYPFIGDHKTRIEPLLDFCSRVDSEKTITSLMENELFENLRCLWAESSSSHCCSFSERYSHILPYILVVQEKTPPPGTKVTNVNLENRIDRALTKGKYVRILNGKVNAIYHDENSVSIKPIHHLLGSRLLLRPASSVSIFSPDQVIDRPIVGIIDKTRRDIITDYSLVAFPDSTNLATDTIELPDGKVIPNLVAVLEEVLTKSFQVRTACIHGDLHLKNIIVEHVEEDVRHYCPHIIDFDQCRRDHILRDLLKLEADVTTRILSHQISNANLRPEIVYEFFTRLHYQIVDNILTTPITPLQKTYSILVSIRQEAKHHLCTPNDWAEYYFGLILYLFGTLKYRELDRFSIRPLPKSIALWHVATILSILDF